MPRATRSTSHGSPNSTLANTANSVSGVNLTGGGSSPTSANQPVLNNPNSNRPQSPNEVPPVQAEWMSEPNPQQQGQGSNNNNHVPSAAAASSGQQNSFTLGSHQQQQHQHHHHTIPATASSADVSPFASAPPAAALGTNNNNNTNPFNTNMMVSSTSNSTSHRATPSLVFPNPNIINTSFNRQFSSDVNVFGSAASNFNGMMMNTQNQQQQQPANISVSECLARTNQLSVFYQDKLLTWGGWFGTGSDKPPTDVLCCYDLNSSSGSNNNNQVVPNLYGATPSSSAVSPERNNNNNSAGVTTTGAAAPAPVSMNTVGWLNGFYKINNQAQCHPASTQFAWTEISPGVIALFGGWTGLTRTNAVTILSIPEMSWKAVDATGDRPPALTFASIVSQNGGKRLAVFGGNGVDGPSSDVYILDMVTLQWRQMPSAGCPPKRSSHSASVVRDSLMVVFGGRGVSDLASLSLAEGLGGGGGANLASLNFNQKDQQGNKSTKSGKSSGKDNANNANSNVDENGYPQAGTLQYANTPLLMNDFGVFDLSSSHWQIGLRVEGVAPPARYGHSTVATNNHIIIFGGIGENNTLLNDVWVLSFDRPGTIQWKPVTFRDTRSITPNTAVAGAATHQQRPSTPPSTSSSPYQPSPRVGSSLSRVSKCCIAVVCGRVTEASLSSSLLVSSSSASNPNNISGTTNTSTINAVSKGATTTSKLMKQQSSGSKQSSSSQQQSNNNYSTNNVVSSTVHFLDISRIVADELQQTPASQHHVVGSGRGSSGIQTPQP